MLRLLYSKPFSSDPHHSNAEKFPEVHLTHIAATRYVTP